MLALRLTRSAHPAVQLRRLLVAAASAGTGFLLLSTLGHALTHPEAPASAALRLAWCVAPLAATVYFARAVARTDPGTRPRPGLAAIGLGPTRLMVVSATTTALSTLLGSMLALLVFLHLRGDLTGMPFDGAASDFLAASRPLPLPAALTLLALVPVASSVAVALMLRPRDARVATGAAGATPRPLGRFGAPRTTGAKGLGETFGAYGRYGTARAAASRSTRPARASRPSLGGKARADARTADGQDAPAQGREGTRTTATNGHPDPRAHGTATTEDRTGQAEDGPAHPTRDGRAEPGGHDDRPVSGPGAEGPGAEAADPRGSRQSDGGGARDTLRRTVPSAVGRTARTVTERLARPDSPDAHPAHDPDAQPTDGRAPEHGGHAGNPDGRDPHNPDPDSPDPDALLFHAPHSPPAPDPTALPWGAALLATGLAVEGYASRTADGGGFPLPGGLPEGPAAVFLGWTLTVVGLALAGPGLTHLCGRLLQSARPGALRLLAGRGLMQEASRIGRPLGVVCAVASGAYTMASLYDPADPSFGPLSTLGALVVAGCTVATLLTSAVEARQARADTTAALLRLGAPTKTLRSAAALRAAALLALFVPLTLVVAELAALPLAG
ncbi:hypothetical protein QA802_29880 [Streptomyces sp. B21-105]